MSLVLSFLILQVLAFAFNRLRLGRFWRRRSAGSSSSSRGAPAPTETGPAAEEAGAVHRSI